MKTGRLAGLPAGLVPVAVAAMLGCGDDASTPMAPLSDQPLAPAAATALSYTQIAVGGQHTCALASDGRAFCWGYAVWGQVGVGADATTINLPTPTPVATSLRFTQLTAGFEFTCGLATDQRAYCWGSNAGGALGDGTFTDRYAPVAVSGGRRFAQIRSGAFHTCGVTPFGGVLCWGNGGWGQLGNGTKSAATAPVKAAISLEVRRVVAGGLHTCAVTTTDKVYCWGRNDRGQLGDGTFTDRLKPVAVTGGLSFTGIVPGANHTCGVTTLHKGYCWGDNEQGQLGIGTTTVVSTKPVAVAGNRNWKQVIAGYQHTCGVTQTGVGFCWGFNFDGQNGDGTTNWSSQPVRIAGTLVFEGISTGVQEASPRDDPAAEHACGLTTDHRVYCWGANLYGQIGDGTSFPDVSRRLTPARVLGPS